ncbi:hypothetical protein ROK90_01100 [Cronobacter dublinensis]|uniref:hypothetical protein n=1 Tax=Cronobacter dublinensis TaxID=413497 RepID=UPI0023DD2D0B|nr:hypothetical protein [Cronobacter dublinensis]MDT3664614.1 hypothetical protein [Cronobacter dublinensis]WEP43678.1 hypothetical protein NNQ27_12470 [Cronobacter dublinensis]
MGGISRGELEQDRAALAQSQYTKENAQRLVNYEIRDLVSDELLAQYRKDPSTLTPEQQNQFQAELLMYTYKNTKLYGEDTANKLLTSLLKDGDTTLLP